MAIVTINNPTPPLPLAEAAKAYGEAMRALVAAEDRYEKANEELNAATNAHGEAIRAHREARRELERAATNDNTNSNTNQE